MPTEQDYSIGELATLAGVTPRTIRYYVSIGLLPSPGQQGPQTRYGDGHLARLRLIRTLQRQHLPLGEIGRRIEGLDDQAVELALQADESAAAPGSALDYIKELRLGQLHPGQHFGPTPAQEALPKEPAATTLRQAEPAAPPYTKPTTPYSKPMTGDRAQWERVWLSDDVELHIRLPQARHKHKQIQRLIKLGRELLEEGDTP